MWITESFFFCFFFPIWQQISNIWNSTWTSSMETPYREFDYFRVISRRFQIAAGPLELETIAKGLVRARLVLRRRRAAPERTRKKQIRQSRKSALQDATKVLTAEALTYFRPSSCLSAYLCPLTSFFYAADPLDLRRGWDPLPSLLFH